MSKTQAPDPALSAIDHLLMDLDMIARERDQYEYGLPIDCTATDGPMEDMRRKVRRFLERETAAIPAPEGGDLLRAAALRAIAALERVAHTNDQERIAAACDLRVALAAPAPQDSLDSAQPSNQLAMQAPVELSADEVATAWDKQARYHGHEPLKLGHMLFAREVIDEFCRINGIPAPQTKEPTNDR